MNSPISETKNAVVSCAVCLDPFNSTTRRLVRCPRCPYEACKSCHSRYLVESISDPHCMNCRYRWSYEFLLQTLSKNFVNGELRRQRGKLLLERAKARIPLVLPFVKIEQTYLETKARLKRIEFAHFNGPLNEPENTLRYRECLMQLNQLQQQRYGATTRATPASTTSAYQFQCPVGVCRGMIEKATSRCAVCKEFVCQRCVKPLGSSVESDTPHAMASDTPMEISDGGIDGGVDADTEAETSGLSATEKEELKQLKRRHKCNPADVESIKEIRRHSRPCPSCHAPISRTEGCDSMWCTQCNTGFNWRTGLVIRDVRQLHNPHYMDFLAKNPNFIYGDAKIPEVAATTPNACDRFTLQTVPIRMMDRAGMLSRNPVLSFYCRQLGDIRQRAIQRFVYANRPDENLYAMKYIQQNWPEKRWRISLEHNDRFRQLNTEYADVILTWITLMNDLYDSAQGDYFALREKIPEMIHLASYINVQMITMDRLYNRVTFRIPNPPAWDPQCVIY